MFRPRVIPVLLLKDKGLVKSVQFKNHRYVGDPINAVKIFNDLKADELVFLDITATQAKRTIPLDFVHRVGDEANMPFAVGGGIQTIAHIKAIINAGAEKVIINSYAVENPDFIRAAAEEFGSSTIVVSIDVKKKFLGKKQVYTVAGTKATGMLPTTWAKTMEEKGAGEIIINSVDRDGTMEGYDIELIREVSEAVEIPVGRAPGRFSRCDTEWLRFCCGCGFSFCFSRPPKGRIGQLSCQ
jgi:imidazole glycerol-phosphate synthase subunit HisF